MVMYDVAVVGAGAAGLMAAIFAARRGKRVVALDGAKKLGAKILISGGGRCNVTHDVVTPEAFNGSRNAIAKVLRTFTVEQTIAFFAELGVVLKREETGKLFPVTDSARTVLEALVGAARDAGVEILTGTRVTAIRHPERSEGSPPRSFAVSAAQDDVAEASTVVLATGGRSVPKTGSDGHGYALARSLGHTITETFPALVPLIVEDGHWIRDLSGTSAEVELGVHGPTGRILHRERGSLLMTHFGISGPVALDISRHWIVTPEARLVVNFVPGVALDEMLLAAARANPRATVASVLRGRVPERVIDVIAPPLPISQMPREQRREVVHELTETMIPVTRDRGFDYAEVTAGGVPLSEVDVATMASRRCPGLFLCGEILDVDGKIGGYNFQWAWASGRLAGLNV